MSIGTSIIRPTATVWRPIAAGYDTDAAAYFAAMTTQPEATRKALIDTLIRGLKTDGLWPKLGGLYLIAAHDAQAARLNAKTPGGTPLSAVNSPTFAADRGYQGDSTSAYLSTGLTHLAYPLMSLDSQHFGVGVKAGGFAAQSLIGPEASSSRIQILMSDQPKLRLGTTTEATVAGVASAQGRFTVNRNSSATLDFFNAGGSKQSFANTTAANSAGVISILRGGTSYSGLRVSYCHFGAGLSDAEAANFDSRISTYLTAIGA